MLFLFMLWLIDGSRKPENLHIRGIASRQQLPNETESLPKERYEKGVRLSSVCTKSIRKLEVTNGYLQGIKYNPADINEKSPAMKAGTYRGIKWESEKKAAKKASKKVKSTFYRGVKTAA